MNPNASPNSTPAHQAAAWLAGGCIFLDTETTGFGKSAEIVDIAVIDTAGHVLLNTLVRPTLGIPADAYAIHGIRDSDVARSPTFTEIFIELSKALLGRRVIIYNRDYDERLLLQSAALRGVLPIVGYSSFCAMRLYANFHGDWNPKRQENRWQKLDAAAQQCGLEWPASAHRALADAQMCRLLVQHMASKAPKPATEPPAAAVPLF